MKRRARSSITAIAILASACGAAGGSATTTADAPPATTTLDGAAPRDGADASDGGSTNDASGAAGGDDAAGASDANDANDAGAWTTRTLGARRYALYVPPSYAAPAPLVVMLHGCDETPLDFAQGTRMNAQADAAGFLVAYPEQPRSANAAACWSWFAPADQARDGEEPAFVAAVVADVARAYAVDPKRVYAAGISAGGAMATIVGATYPDLFAAIAVHSGLEFAAASDAAGASVAMRVGGPDPVGRGDAAYAAMGARARVVPVIVVQGDADLTVSPTNGREVIAQWARTNDRASDGAADGNVTATPTSQVVGQANGRSFVHATYADARSGAVVMELFEVSGLAHAWSGGAAGAPYADPAGPSATAEVWRFFAAHARLGT